MSELLITSSLDSVKAGQSFVNELPRHVTVWQYFEIADYDINEFIFDVGEAVEGFSPLEIVGAENDNFGPNNDVFVRRIRALGGGATVKALHAVIGSIIEEYEGSIRNPEWAYDGYNPHITYVDGRALEEGEREILTSLELIERDPATKIKSVRKIWQLEEA